MVIYINFAIICACRDDMLRKQDFVYICAGSDKMKVSDLAHRWRTRPMKLEVADYIELKDGGAVVIFEMDEETRTGLISEAIKRRLVEGLERMSDVPREENDQIDLEEYIAGLETGGRVDSTRPTEESSGLQGVDENEGETP